MDDQIKKDEPKTLYQLTQNQESGEQIVPLIDAKLLRLEQIALVNK
jgi:hypothetical protein